MTYSLRRTCDNAGDSGPMSQALIPDLNEDGSKVVKAEDNARPRLGVAMRIGSYIARTYSTQDWWQTTLITEILSDTPNEVHFKTTNSEYIWKEF